MKRVFDIVCSAIGLIVFSPLLLTVMYLVWRQDHESPLYIAARTGSGEKPFNMIKLRSMVKNADKSGVDSTSSSDMRITPVGHFIRRYKLDEISQLWNVLKGDMSLVGPRPNVKRETDLYTHEEKGLLAVAPGITDFASIVFADEGSILEGKPDPDLAYNQLIRPWKSRLGLFYVKNRSLPVDITLLLYTAMAIVSRRRALTLTSALLKRLGADDSLVRVALRENELLPSAPPGATEVVMSRAAN